MKRAALTLAAFVLATTGASAQRGDVKDEAQPPLKDEWKVPIPKPLSAEEELATFHVDDGLRVELVACEPLVRDPICAVFDELGRLWVVEMSAYMPDYDGNGEDAANGSIVVLRDTDGDGRMDVREVFLDQLVLPRAVAPTRGGALIIAPPRLLFARDTDGDGRADDVRVVDDALQGIASPEHAINGLMYGLDNWFWCANAPVRYRWNGDRLEKGRTAGSGQWGITEDKWGRIYTNDNSNPLRCDLYPSNYAVRNPNLGVAPGMGVNVAIGARPHPSHKTPGVNRGYRAGLLDEEGKLHEFTGACAPWIYEGDALPERYRGSAIVCEPCGNLLHRFEIAYDEHGYPKATTAPPDGAMLTSTDERFRPVFLNEGPDGALYVVDMYRGVFQHKLFVTSWLRKQMEERELAQPLHRGRIWRVTSGERKALALDLTKCSWTELANCVLYSPNRWLRKTSQRLFVEQGAGDRDAIEVLHEYACDPLAPTNPGFVNAVWALSGLKSCDVLLAHHVRAEVESDAPMSTMNVVRLISEAANAGDLRARNWKQAVLAREEIRYAPAAIAALGESTADDELKYWVRLLPTGSLDDPIVRGAIAAGLAARELAFVDALLHTEFGTHNSSFDPVSPPQWSNSGSDLTQHLGSGWTSLVETIAACVVNESHSERIERLLNLVVSSDIPTSCQLALARGALSARSKDAAGKLLPIRLDRRPLAADWFGKIHTNEAVVTELANSVIWPDKPGSEGMWPRELTERERARFERGQGIFEQTCASCHQLGGTGDIALAPPLHNSPYVVGDAKRLVKIVSGGLRGRVELNGMAWDGEMPAFGAGDEELASVLTYLRRAWNHIADPVEPDLVREVREKSASHKGAWSVDEVR